jgi:hypothetical protein
MPCKVCSGRFKILLHAKSGQIGLPKLKRSLGPHITESVRENPHHWLRVKEKCSTFRAVVLNPWPAAHMQPAYAFCVACPHFCDFLIFYHSV